MRTKIRAFLGKVFSIVMLGIFSCFFLGSISGNVYAQEGERFRNAIDETVNTRGNQDNPELSKPLVQYFQSYKEERTGISGLRDLIGFIGVKVLIPVLVVAGIVVAIVGFYKLMFQTGEEDITSATNYIIYGLIGTVVMVTAGRLTFQLVGTDGTGGIESIFNFSGGVEFDGPRIAEQIYIKIGYPILRLFLVFAMGILFIVVLLNAIKIVFNPEDDLQKKAIRMLIFAVVGIIVIMLSKTIVETVFGTYDSVVDAINTDTGLAGVGEPILENAGGGVSVNAEGSLSLLWTIVNRVLSLSVFIVTIIILRLGYMLLIQPNDEGRLETIKSYLLYMIIGIFIIGSAYMISRLFLVAPG